MTDPTCLPVPVDEVLGQALRARAAREGLSPGEAAAALLRQALAAEIEEARGVPPLAAVIQQHHQRGQAALRQAAQRSDPPVNGQGS